MQPAQITDSVRNSVLRTFVELGIDADLPLRETILIRDGHYCGRRFESGDLTALWLLDDRKIDISRADGTVVQTILVAESKYSSTRAAA
jgi:hypothetical protein